MIGEQERVGTDRAAVTVVGLDKGFGRRQVLAGLDLDLGPGVVGLLGPNGAGKTTLLRILATVLAPDEGTVRLLGLDPTDHEQRVAIRQQLGYLPQDPGLYPRFTPFEFVDYVAILKELTDRRTRHDEVRRVLAAVGLEAEAHRRIRTLSGGMRRRVGLAQALLGQPRLLVLDEPTAGLDPSQRVRFRELISALGTDRTVLISTHQTEDVTALGGRVVVLDAGQVHFDGTPTQLIATAEGRVWRGADRDVTATVGWRSGDGTFRNLGHPPAGAELLPPTLEDAYLLLQAAPPEVPS